MVYHFIFSLSLQNAIEFFSIGTPITNQHYLNAKAGATYGLDHGFERFSPKMASLLRPETGIDGTKSILNNYGELRRFCHIILKA
jgi:hypothetical protein